MILSVPARMPRVIAVVLTVLMLAACAPAPERPPTPPAAFASEEEAFAAAEETYRAYIAALNEVNVADPATFEALYEHTSGDVEQSDRRTFSSMSAEGYSVTGETRITFFGAEKSEPELTGVIALACLDVSAVKVTDPSGVSVVDPDRPNVYALRINFRQLSGRFLISTAERVEDSRCA